MKKTLSSFPGAISSPHTPANELAKCNFFFFPPKAPENGSGHYAFLKSGEIKS